MLLCGVRVAQRPGAPTPRAECWCGAPSARAPQRHHPLACSPAARSHFRPPQSELEAQRRLLEAENQAVQAELERQRQLLERQKGQAAELAREAVQETLPSRYALQVGCACVRSRRGGLQMGLCVQGWGGRWEAFEHVCTTLCGCSTGAHTQGCGRG